MKKRKIFAAISIVILVLLSIISPCFAIPELPDVVEVEKLNWAHQYYYPDYYSSFEVTLDDSFKGTWLYTLSDNGKLFLEIANYRPSTRTSYYVSDLLIVNEEWFFGVDYSSVDYRNFPAKRGMSGFFFAAFRDWYTWGKDPGTYDGLKNPRTVEMYDNSRRKGIDVEYCLYIKRNITNGVKSISLWMGNYSDNVRDGYKEENIKTNIINVDMSTYKEQFWLEDELDGEDITDYDHTEKYIEYVEGVLFGMNEEKALESGVVNIEGEEYLLCDADEIHENFEEEYPAMFYEKPYLVPRSELVAPLWEGYDEDELADDGATMVDGKRFKVNALDAVMKNSVYKSKFIGEMEFDAVGCGKEWVKDLSYYGNLNFHIYFFEIEKTERDGNVSNFEEQYMCVTGEDGERWFKGKNFEASKLPPGLYDKEARVQDDVTAFMQFEALSEFSPEYIVYDGRDKIDIQLYLNYTDATKSEVESIEFSGDAIGNVTRIDYEKAKYIFQFKSCRDSEEKKELGAKMYEFAETLPKPDFYNVEEKQEEQKPKPDKITVYINGEEVKFI